MALDRRRPTQLVCNVQGRGGEGQMGDYRVVADPRSQADQQVEILRQALERRAQERSEQAAKAAQNQKK